MKAGAIMNKIIINIFVFIFFTLFAASAQAQEFNTTDPECYNAMSNLKSDSTENDEASQIILMGTVYTACLKEVYVDNTTTRIMYFMFGDVYLEALGFSSYPFEKIFSLLDRVRRSVDEENNIYSGFDVRGVGELIEEVQSEYERKDTIMFGGSVSTIMKSMVFLTNSLITLILIYVASKLVLSFQRGDFESAKNFTTKIVRVSAGISLMAPFIGGYSLVQFLILAAIGLGTSFASVFYIMIYSAFIDMEMEDVNMKEMIDNQAQYLMIDESVQGLYKNLVIGNLCTIKETEKIISENIPDSRLVYENAVMDKSNFIKCLSSGGIINSEFTSSNETLNRCLERQGFYFNQNGDKVDINASEVNCGKFVKTDRNYIMDLRNRLNKQAEEKAIKIHEIECLLNNKDKQTGNNYNFKCVKLNNIGDFKFKNNNIELFESQENYPMSDIEISFEKEMREHSQDIFYNVTESHKEIKKYIYENSPMRIGNQDTGEDYNSTVDDFKKDAYGRILRNGWLHGFSIFTPKSIISDLSDAAPDFFWSHKEKEINVFTKNNVFNVESVLGDESNDQMSAFYRMISESNLNVTLNLSEEESKLKRVAGAIIPSFAVFGNRMKEIDESANNQKRFEKCIIGRDRVNCESIFGDKMITNPIQTFHATVSSAGDFVVVGLVGGYGLSRTFSADNYPKLHNVADFVYVISMIMMAVYILGVFLIVLVPFFIFISAILEWIFKVLKAPFLIQALALDYVLPNEEEDTVSSRDQEKKLYRLIGEMLLGPFFIIVGVFVAFSTLIVGVALMTIISFIVFNTLIPPSDSIFVSMVYYFSSLGLYIVFSAFMIFFVSKKMLSFVTMINSYFGFDQFNESNQFEKITNTLRSKVFI